MKIAFLTQSLDEHHGWGRYSKDLIASLHAARPGLPKIVFTQELPSFGLSEFPFVIQRLPGSPVAGRFLKLVRLLRLVRQLKPILADVTHIHCLTEELAPLGYLLSKRKHFFLTAHGTRAVTPLTRWYLRPFYTLMYRRADRIICVSRYTEVQIKRFVPNARTTVINNGVSTALTSTTLQLPQVSDYILSVGALKRRKGLETSLGAFAKLAKDYPSTRYVIVAGAKNQPYLDYLRKMINEWGVEGRVLFHFGVSEQELAGLYQKADFFVLTPINEGLQFEGFGLVYFEAALFGKPSIGTRGNGAEDAIEHERTGLLVNQRDVEATAEAMKRLLNDKKLRDRLGRAAQTKANQQTWRKVIERYLSVYSQ